MQRQDVESDVFVWPASTKCLASFLLTKVPNVIEKAGKPNEADWSHVTLDSAQNTMNSAKISVLPLHKRFATLFEFGCLQTICIVLLTSCGPNGERSSQAPHIEQPQSSIARIMPTGLQKEVEALNQKPLTIEDFETRVAAVKQIGTEKRVESVPLLLDKLLQITPLTINNAVEFSETYPCSAALVQIGEAAVPEIERRFLKAGSDVEQLVLLDTLLNIKGAAYVAEWIGKIPENGSNALPKKRRTELKQWALSQAH